MRIPTPIALVVLTALYLGSCVLGETSMRMGGDVTLFWPAAGIGVAAVMRFGLPATAIVPAALLPYHLVISPVPGVFVVGSLLANTLGTLAGGWLARRSQGEDALDLASVVAIVAGGIVLAVLSAIIGVPALLQAGMMPGEGTLQAFARWILGDFLGVVAVTPAVLAVLRTGTGPVAVGVSPLAEESERLAWLTLLALSLLLMAWGASLEGEYTLGLTALPLALLAWAALRFPPGWTVGGTLGTILMIGVMTGQELSGFAAPRSVLDTLNLLGYLCILALLPLLLASTVLERRRASDRLVLRATTDPNTGLPNRQSFEEQVRHALAAPDSPPRALAYLDLDHLKVINDTASHAAGDAYLQGVAGVLRANLPKADLLAHLGGDEFGLLLHNYVPAAAEDRATDLLRAVASYRCAWEGDALATTASIGLVPFHATDGDYGKLLSQADAACFSAKESGGNRVCMASLHGDDGHDRTQAMQWAVRLREAIQRRNLVLFCQPIVPLQAVPGEDEGRHFEVLLRVRDHVSGELLLPHRFLAAAARFNMGVAIDREVVGATLSWLETHADLADVDTCSVNLSAEALVDESFIGFLVDRLRNGSFPAHKLCLEITETSAVRDLARAQRFIQQMRSLGCRFSLDDFGTGFCAFSYLRDLDVDYLKIDGSFVRDPHDSELAHAVVRSITEIAHVLGKQTIAEQVETDAQRMKMQRMGVDHAQGHYFRRPQPMAEYFATPQLRLSRDDSPQPSAPTPALASGPPGR
ncbi:putative bifunctional diguanylate cyclase/phosphodiesterase [Luteimonas vadosa]|uniref:EAL domain-containing protein n=1 Tax=Luteimonas vadosa TaxID=1165507 RepID=A0ABP9DUS8_9GAMM